MHTKADIYYNLAVLKEATPYLTPVYEYDNILDSKYEGKERGEETYRDAEQTCTIVGFLLSVVSFALFFLILAYFVCQFCKTN